MRHALLASFFLLACGPAKVVADAGPDTSCGVDCAAQNRYGLVVNRCFEYSNDPLGKRDPPDLGVLVLPVATLEGNVTVIPVEYRVLGQIKMRDSFALKSSELWLMRREFTATGQSVTYRDSAMNITGVKWLAMNSGAGETSDTSTQALVVNASGNGATTPTAYRLTTAAASTSELRTPLLTYPDGLKLLVGETPDHGSDPRRVYVPDVGFAVLASAFTLAGGTPTPVSLQRIRDLGTPDAGSADCSLGAP